MSGKFLNGFNQLVTHLGESLEGHVLEKFRHSEMGWYQSVRPRCGFELFYSLHISPKDTFSFQLGQPSHTCSFPYFLISWMRVILALPR